MKASEAMLLGSMLIPPIRGGLGIMTGEPGCAIGMIGETIGRRDSFGITRKFPVLDIGPLKTPCDCEHGVPYRNMWGCIAHMFDHHIVMPDLDNSLVSEPWTLEQLAEWLSGIEDAYEAKMQAPLEGKNASSGEEQLSESRGQPTCAE